MNYPEIVRAGYNAIAGKYLASRTRDSEDILLLDELTRRLQRGAHILDAGCGAGIPVAQILSRDFRVTGVDFSISQVELARQHVPQASFLCQDMTALGFPAESFDAVCSYYAIIHIPRQEHRQILQGFHRLLKKDGLALLCLGWDDLEDDIEEDYLGTRMYWSHFGSRTYLAMLEKCPFQVLLAKRITDASFPEGGHLFVLAQKGPMP